MRPKKLVVQGFGPFVERTEVDFTALDQLGVYLIVGDTGAGKTTLLDAMTYALFAKVATGRDVQSTFVTKNDVRVELMFEHGGVDHRVVRGAKSGDDAYQALPSGAATTKRTEVTTKVEELLHLTADQFMKIILLPQGQFQEFLKAKTPDKTAILRRIFGTELYDRVAERIGEYADALREQIGDAMRRIDTMTQLAVAEVDRFRHDAPGLALPEDSHDFDAVLAAGRRELPAVAALAKSLTKDLEELVSERAKAADAAQLFDDKVALTELEEVARTQAREVRAASAALDANERSQRALRLQARYEETLRKRDELRTMKMGLEREITRCATRVAPDLPRVRSFRTAIGSARDLTEEFGAMSQSVTTVLEAMSERDRLEEEFADSSESVAETTRRLSSCKRDIVRHSAALKKLRRDRTGVNKDFADLPRLERELDRLERELERADVARLESDLDAAAREISTAKKALATATGALEKAQLARDRHEVGMLAQRLSTGDPCPVCGAIEHPDPATVSRKVDLRGPTNKVADAKARLATAERDAGRLRNELSAAEKVAARLPSTAEQRKLRARVKAARSNAKVRDRIEKAHDEAAEGLAEARALQSGLGADLKAGEAESTRLRAALDRAVRAAPQRIPDDKRRATKHALTALRPLVRELSKAADSLAKQEAGLETLRAELHKAVSDEGFRSMDAAVEAHLDARTVARHSRLVDEAEERDSQITELRARVSGREVPKVRPRTKDLDDRIADQRAERDHVTERRQALTSLVDRLSSVRSTVAELRPTVEAAGRQLADADRLQKVMRTGEGVGVDRIHGLEEWIQRRLFTQVCTVASERLRTLTDNRYVITLEFDEDSAIKQARGLDLYVRDSHNGTTRGVGSLSGGETFLAALALALALADVLQSYAGGIQIPCLFIDEGFGGLDAGTLETAMNVLERLPATGRIVGIVTHVKAMERLPTGIRVIKSDKGSRLEFPTRRTSDDTYDTALTLASR